MYKAEEKTRNGLKNKLKKEKREFARNGTDRKKMNNLKKLAKYREKKFFIRNVLASIFYILFCLIVIDQKKLIFIFKLYKLPYMILGAIKQFSKKLIKNFSF